MELLIIIASLLIAALVCLLSKYRRVIEFVSVTALPIVFIESIFVALNVASLGVYAPFRLFSIDALGAIVVLIISFIGCVSAFYSVLYLHQESAKQIVGFHRVKEYFVLFHLFLLAMFFAITTTNPIIMWISIEATTLSTVFLISFYNKPSAIEAAWKYLIINSVGLLLGFFGTLLYFTAIEPSQRNAFTNWDMLLTNASSLDPLIAKIAFIFVFIGYGTKVGFFPMHTWKPDAYSKAPAPIGALFSGALLPVSFIALLKFKLVTDIAVGGTFSNNLLIIFGTLSIVIAAFIIFTQKNYKRLLAYSSIEHAGIMALGFGFGGLGIFAAILHMIYHSFIKSALFFSAGNIFLKYSSTKIAKVKGAMKVIPLTSVLFLIGFLSLTGIPPLGLFLTKMYVLSAGIEVRPGVVIIVLISSIILFVGFLKHSTAMIFGEKEGEIKTREANPWLIIPALVMIVAALYLSFHIPTFIDSLLRSAASQYSL